MSAGIYNIYAEQGATFERECQYTDDSGTPIDITGGSLRMQVRGESGDIILDLTSSGITITDASQGEFTILIDATTMESVDFGNFKYDLEYVQGSVVERLFEGSFVISENITR